MDDPRPEQESGRALQRIIRPGEHGSPGDDRHIQRPSLTRRGLCRVSVPLLPDGPLLLDLYHGTASGLLASILEKGLVPRGAAGSDCWAIKHRRYAIVDASAEKRPASVYLVKQQTLSHCYAEHAAEMNPGSTAVILHLRLPSAIAAKMKSDELDDDAQRFEGVIKAEWIAAISRVT